MDGMDIQGNWVATVLIDSYHEKDPRKNYERCKEAELIIDHTLKNTTGDGVILFPAGWFHTGGEEEDQNGKKLKNCYNKIFTYLSPLLKHPDRRIIACIGIDGQCPGIENGADCYDKDQVAFAFDGWQWVAIGRKYHRNRKAGENDSNVNAAEGYNELEDGYPRIFSLNGKKYYLAVCNDIFGPNQRKGKYGNNPGADAVLNFIHRFTKSSSLGRFQNGPKYCSILWKCPVYSAPIFINRYKPIPENAWPSAFIYDPATNNSFSIDADLIPKLEMGGEMKENDVQIRIYYHNTAPTFGKSSLHRETKAEKSLKSENWSENSFIENLKCKKIPLASVLSAQELIRWSRSYGLNLGEKTKNKSFIPFLPVSKTVSYQIFGISTNGDIIFQFKYLYNYSQFLNPSNRAKLIEILNKVAGMNLDRASIEEENFPKRPLGLLDSKKAMDSFLFAIEWFFRTVSIAEG